MEDLKLEITILQQEIKDLKEKIVTLQTELDRLNSMVPEHKPAHHLPTPRRRTRLWLEERKRR